MLVVRDEETALVECYWWGKTEVLGCNSVPLQLRAPQISHGLTWDRAWIFAVRGVRLTA